MWYFRKDLHNCKGKYKILSNSDGMKDIFENTELIISRRQTKNLRKLLTKTEFSTNIHEQHTVINAKNNAAECVTF